MVREAPMSLLGNQKMGVWVVALSTTWWLFQLRKWRVVSTARASVVSLLSKAGLVTAGRRTLPGEEEDNIPIAHAVVTEGVTEAAALPPPPPKATPPTSNESFGSTGSCLSQRVVSLGAEGCERLVASLREQRRQSWSPDVVVANGEREFAAHACVLEATSPVLAEEARRAVRGRTGEGLPRIRLDSAEDDDTEALALVLDFAYGTLVTVSEANVEKLLELASRLQIRALVDECCAFVAQRTSASRACRVLALADKHRCTLLRRDVGLCVLRHFKEACGLFPDTDDATSDHDEALRGFLALPRHLLDELLHDDRLCVDDESRVFLAAVAWLQSDPNRLADADAVLALVRYYLVSAEFLADTVEPHELMQSRACKDLVHAAYRWQALPPTRRSEKAVPVRRTTSEHDTFRDDSDDARAPPSLPNEDDDRDLAHQRGGESSSRHRLPLPPKTLSRDDSGPRQDASTDRRSSGQENPFLTLDDKDDALTPDDPGNRQAFV